MREGYFLGHHRGKFVAVLYERGDRQGRHPINAADEDDAKRKISTLNAARDRDQLPEQLTAGAIMGLYIADRKRANKAAVSRMKQCQKLLEPMFGALHPMMISKKLCEDYIEARRNINVGDASIRTEMTYLAVALKFATDHQLIKDRPRIWRPSPPRPRSAQEDYHLTHPEAERLLKAAEQTPHLRLWIVLALATAGRPLHILQLTWDRVDFHKGTINLDDPGQDRTAKGRARVPMNEEVREALLEARRRGGKTRYVIEFNGKPLKRIKGALERAAKRAGVKASPYVLRHTAGVWMAEAGVPMEEIAQYMGHSNPLITFKVYARFSPTHLKRAANALKVVRGSDGTHVPAIRNVSGTNGLYGGSA